MPSAGPGPGPGPGPLVAVGTASDIATGAAQPWLQHATFTLCESDIDDLRVVTVPSADECIADLAARVDTSPQSATVCDQVLRSIDPLFPTLDGMIMESLAYSTLQSGAEFARWLAHRGPAHVVETPEPVLLERIGETLHIRLNRPARHNAFSTDTRAALLEALDVAWHDDSVREVVLAGNGPSFCSGGDLAEFGSLDDPVSAHLARIRFSPGLILDALTAKLGPRCHARVHGNVLGSGLEMAAFCGRIEAHPDSVFGLPELSLGLLPGAGGTVSVPRRIGRWRTAYLILSGRTVDTATALQWGLVDAIPSENAA